MSAAPIARTGSGDSFVRVVVTVAGIGYLLTGLALVFAPEWFYQYIGFFPPFNRHYAGDLGMFQIPLGVGLLIALRNPIRHRGLIGVAAAGSLLHVFNHLIDDLAAGNPAHLFADIAPLLLLAVLLLAAWYLLMRNTP